MTRSHLRGGYVGGIVKGGGGRKRWTVFSRGGITPALKITHQGPSSGLIESSCYQSGVHRGQSSDVQSCHGVIPRLASPRRKTKCLNVGHFNRPSAPSGSSGGPSRSSSSGYAKTPTLTIRS